MAVETATYISQLNTSYPLDGDIISEGDNHLRLVKSVLQGQFTSLGTAAVTVTAAQLNDVTNKSLRAGDTYTGTHNFSGATAITVPTVTTSDSSTNGASTAFVKAAIAAVNAQSPTTLSVATSAAISASSGQHIVCTNASASTITLPSGPSAGDSVWVTVGNGRTDNVIARNGLLIMGLSEDMTVNNAYATVQLRYINSSLGWRLV